MQNRCDKKYDRAACKPGVNAGPNTGFAGKERNSLLKKGDRHLTTVFFAGFFACRFGASPLFQRAAKRPSATVTWPLSPDPWPLAPDPCPMRSRRNILDDAKRRMVIALVTQGSSRRVAGRYVGCAGTTITRTAQRDPEFAAQLARAEQMKDHTTATTIVVSDDVQQGNASGPTRD